MSSLDDIRRRAETDARSRGYAINPDEGLVGILIEGLRQNETRYGYLSCPCRLSTGDFDKDKDIVCPCDYRDADVEEFGCCYCALYVRKDVAEGRTPARPIPERRSLKRKKQAFDGVLAKQKTGKPGAEPPKASRPAADAGMRLWYCEQCGYVAFRDEPPHLCPVCKAKQDRFKEVEISVLLGSR